MLPSTPQIRQNKPSRRSKKPFFLRKSLHDLPVELHTQFFKPSDEEAKLAVLAHVDVRRIRYRKVDGRNTNELTVVAAPVQPQWGFCAGHAKKSVHALEGCNARKQARFGNHFEDKF